jgi:hypothetical protein
MYDVASRGAERADDRRRSLNQRKGGAPVIVLGIVKVELAEECLGWHRKGAIQVGGACAAIHVGGATPGG